MALDVADVDARFNHELVKKKLEQLKQQQKQEQEKKDGEKSDEQKEQDKKEQQQKKQEQDKPQESKSEEQQKQEQKKKDAGEELDTPEQESNEPDSDNDDVENSDDTEQEGGSSSQNNDSDDDFDTNFLKLITELSNNEDFQSLDLFTEITSKRMNDIDFISELVTYLIEGISDKKIKVDKVFENDITENKYESLKTQFENILNVFSQLNTLYPLKKTRYKQRNDFYSLFGFIDKNINLNPDTIKYFYQLLLKFNDDITPSNENCKPFQLYAFHCISQSNSKSAREERLNILSNIFLNKNEKTNKHQKAILKYYGLSIDDVATIEDYLNISLEKLN
jgi:hypothetical protein